MFPDSKVGASLGVGVFADVVAEFRMPANVQIVSQLIFMVMLILLYTVNLGFVEYFSAPKGLLFAM